MTTLRNAILLVNMGGPKSLGDVKPFLSNLFDDRDIIKLPFQSLLSKLIVRLRSAKVAEKYSQIGGASPIHHWTNLQAEGLVRKLQELYPDQTFESFIGFRYSDPNMEDALDRIEKQRFDRAFFVSNYFQYSCTTTGSSINAFCKYYNERKLSPNHNNRTWHLIDRYPTSKLLLGAFRDRIKRVMDENNLGDDPNTILIFSAHSIPLSVMDRGDCYPSEVAATVHGIMKLLNYQHPFRLTWQSKVGPTKWIGPSTERCLEQMLEQNNMRENNSKLKFIVVPVTFNCDHIETIHEINIELRENLEKKFKNKFEIHCVEAFNASESYINVMSDQIVKKIDGSLHGQREQCKQLMMRCPGCENQKCIDSRKLLSNIL